MVILSRHDVWIYLLLIFIALLLWRTGKAKKRAPLPPGPQKWPAIGNLLDMPRVKPWLMYHDWAKQYGNSRSLVDGRRVTDSIAQNAILYISTFRFSLWRS